VRTLYYLVLAPIFGGLSVLAIWRFARGAGTRAAWLAAVVAVMFLLLQSGAKDWGAFAVRRPAQGKTILVLLVVPWLWHHATEYARTRSGRSLAWLAIGGVSAIGFSSSGSFIAVLVVGAALVALLLDASSGLAPRGRLRSVVIGASTVLYPAVASMVGASSISLPSTYSNAIVGSADAWSRPMGDGIDLVVTTMIALAGWTIVGDRRTRLGLGVAVLIVVVLFTPFTLDALSALGLGQAVWRIAWVIPLPALVGLVAEAALRWERFGRRIACVGVVSLLGVVLAAGGERPVLGNQRHSAIGAPTWDMNPVARRAAERLTRLAPSGGVVAAPLGVAWFIPQVTTEVYPVSATRSYTRILGRAVGENFHASERALLADALGGRPRDAAAVRRALAVLDVDAGCSGPRVSSAVLDALRSSGLRNVGRDTVCTYWSR
jgi:hypothetical protein